MIGVLTLVRIVVAVAMLGIVPLGLRLVDAPGAAVLRRVWPVPAAVAAGAQFLPRGTLAAALAVPYLGLTVSSTVLAATMLLALGWALGEATGLPHPTLAWMAATHGVANALGFALCAVLAWRRLAADPL